MSAKFDDLTGKRFGRLIVMGRASNMGRSICWECICDCGNKKIIRSKNLRAKTRSCGCLQKELAKARIGEMHKTRRGWYSKEYIAKMTSNAVSIVKIIIKDADNGILPKIASAYQTTYTAPPKPMFFEEKDETAINLIEPKKKIIWDTQLTGIQND